MPENVPAVAGKRGRPRREFLSDIQNYPKTEMEAREARMPDFTEELNDDTPNVRIDVSTTRRADTEASKEYRLTQGRPESDLSAVSTGVRRRRHVTDPYDLTAEDRKRYGIKPSEKVCWPRAEHWVKVENVSRVRATLNEMPGARLIKDPQTNETVQVGDNVCVAYPKEYDDEVEEQINEATMRMYSDHDAEAHIPDMSSEIGEGPSRTKQKNYERTRRNAEDQREHLEIMRHMNSKQAHARGWIGPASKTNGWSVEDVLEHRARQLGGGDVGKRAAQQEFYREQAMHRRVMVGSEWNADLEQHEARMRDQFAKSKGKEVHYSLPSAKK